MSLRSLKRNSPTRLKKSERFLIRLDERFQIVFRDPGNLQFCEVSGDLEKAISPRVLENASGFWSVFMGGSKSCTGIRNLVSLVKSREVCKKHFRQTPGRVGARFGAP